MNYSPSLFIFCFLGASYFLVILLGLDSVFNLLLIIASLSQLLCVRYSRLNFENPLLWYSSALFFYHFSSLYLASIGFYTYSSTLESLLFYGMIYYSSVAPLFLCKNKSLNEGLLSRFDEYFDAKIMKNIFYIFMVLTFFVNLQFMLSGYTSKGDAILANGGALYFIFNWSNVIALICMLRFRNERFLFTVIFLSFVFFLFTSLNTGERNVILNFLLNLIIVMVLVNKINKKKSIIYLFFAALSIPLLQQLKNVFIKETITVDFNDVPIYVSFFRGEFLSASRNIDWLLKRQDQFEFTYGTNVINDVFIGLIPFNTGLTNSQTWYNNTFFSNIVETGQGYGFSLYASFYLAYGYVSLVILSLFFSTLLLAVYNKSKNNVFLFLLSILLISPLIYSQRGDLSVVFSYIIKQTLIPLTMFYIFSYLRRKVLN